MLRECDFAEMAALLGDAAIQGRCLADKRRLLVAKIARSLCADAWVWGEPRRELDRRLRLVRVMARSADPGGGEEVRACSRQLPGEAGWTGIADEALPHAESGIVRLSSAGRGVPRELPFLLVIRRSAGGRLSAFASFRDASRTRFSQRELKIAGHLLAGVPWLHSGVDEPAAGDSRAVTVALSPRLRSVQSLLLRGLPRKEVAHRLGLRLNTVHGYAKELYRRYGVHSQAELICRLGSGVSAVA